jgi:cob(I)alamin adenosyltransferase
MARLYTKTGDKGTSSLYDMRTVKKCDDVFEALGDLDELSAYIGDLCVTCENNDILYKQLRVIQSKLLDIGSDIATFTDKNREKLVLVCEQDVKDMEKMIDFYHEKSPKLREFILPGVNNRDSKAHICRSVCRRFERHAWKVKDTIKTDNYTFHYINRLSDFFFALGRFLSDGKEFTRSMS